MSEEAGFLAVFGLSCCWAAGLVNWQPFVVCGNCQLLELDCARRRDLNGEVLRYKARAGMAIRPAMEGIERLAEETAKVGRESGTRRAYGANKVWAGC